MNAKTPFTSTALALENCAKEALHQTALIQPHGFVLACDAETGVIGFESANARQFVATAESSLLGKPLSDLLLDPPEAVLRFLASVPEGDLVSGPLRFRSKSASSGNFEVVAHRTGHWVVLETMPFPRGVTQVDTHIQLEHAVRGVGALHLQKKLPEFLNACASEIRKLAQYQRVIIYRFLPDWSGEVIGESVDEGVPTRFLGLRFPASDIPPQARALYRANRLRIIADVDAEPVALKSAAPDVMLDQTHTVLRSPSPMHLGYLRNMGVRASMTISLMKDGELWGMVSCHHPAPKAPPAELRRVTKMLCALVAELAMVRIDALLQEQMMLKKSAVQQTLGALAAAIQNSRDFEIAVPTALNQLAQTLNFQAYGLMIDGQWRFAPQVPDGLKAHLERRARGKLSAEADFSDVFMGAGQAQAWSPWAGMACVALPGHDNCRLFLLRQAVAHLVHWAGAPSTDTETLPSGMVVLGPRQSFEKWTQQVQDQSEPWSDFDRTQCVEVAKSLATAYLKHKNFALEAELRLLGVSMEHLNDMVIVSGINPQEQGSLRIIYVNKAFTTQTGFDRAEVVGRSPRFLVGDETDPVSLKFLKHALSRFEASTLELQIHKKNGESFWTEVNLSPIPAQSGETGHWVTVLRNIEERKRSQTEIQKLVYYDTLTNLPNRRMAMDRLSVALGNCRRYGRQGAVILVDLDHFKTINDTAGHPAGDDLLRQVASRLRAQVRLEDTVARLGGDEFMVLLEGLEIEQGGAAGAAQRVSNKILASLCDDFEFPLQRFNSSASLGITLFKGDVPQPSVEDLLKQADFAMYQAKEAGRNTWRFYDPKTQADLVERNALEADLKGALAQQTLELHFQPIYDRTRQIAGAEALLRWNHPRRGWVSPGEFIPMAEQSDLIIQIGTWVLDCACKVLALWALHPVRQNWTLAVNVSERQIRKDDFVETVQAMIHASGCNPSRLKLELTEGLLQSDLAATTTKMERLRTLGILFSIDDFGTGYSSLSYLRRLPISVLKIDRSFVRDLESDTGDRAICQTVLALGQTMDLRIVAEGVEDLAQFDFLHRAGCDFFQGFLFSKALPLSALEQLA